MSASCVTDLLLVSLRIDNIISVSIFNFGAPQFHRESSKKTKILKQFKSLVVEARAIKVVAFDGNFKIAR